MDDLFGSDDLVDDGKDEVNNNLDPIVSIGVRNDVGGRRCVTANKFIPSGTLIIFESPTIEWKDIETSNILGVTNMIRRILSSKRAVEVTKELYFDNDVMELSSDYLHAFSSLTAEYNTSIEEISRIFMVLKHNGFNSGLYRYLSMFNHSCSPNCIKYPPKGTSLNISEIWAVKNIESGEELTICYLEQLELSQIYRQNYLLRNHNFHCDCSRCYMTNFDNKRGSAENIEQFLYIENEWYGEISYFEEATRRNNNNFSDFKALVQKELNLYLNIKSLNLDVTFETSKSIALSRLLYSLVEIQSLILNRFFLELECSFEEFGLNLITHNIDLYKLQVSYLGSEHPNLIRTHLDIASSLMSFVERFPQSVSKIQQTVTNNEIKILIEFHKNRSDLLKKKYSIIKNYPNFYKYITAQHGYYFWNNKIIYNDEKIV